MRYTLLKNSFVPVSFGLLLAAIWVPIGIITYMNTLAGSMTLKYIVHFLLGLPLIVVIFGLILLRKKSAYHIFSISYLILTFLITVLIPIIAES